MTMSPEGAEGAPQPEALRLSQVLARNLRAYRAAHGWSQSELSTRLEALGLLDWSEQTVGHVERGRRAITVDELAALAVTLEVPVPVLLSSAGPARALGPYLAVGRGMVPPPLARWLTTSPELDDDNSRTIVLLASSGPAPASDITTKEDQ
jgi:transcriptional regulator with XRE-family HTH domain